MCRLRRGAICALTALAAAALATAELVQVRDAPGGEDPTHGPYTYYLEGTANGGDPVGTALNGAFQTLYDGAFALEMRAGQDIDWSPLITYCLEPMSNIAFGPHPDDLVGIAFQTAQLTDLPGISAQEAEWIEVLWGNAFADSLTGVSPLATSIKASAFQALIWEFRQDDQFALTGPAGAGNKYRLNDALQYTGWVIGTATAWFNNIQDGAWTSRTPLLALTSPETQDYILPVPEPASAMLLIVGLALLRRR